MGLFTPNWKSKNQGKREKWIINCNPQKSSSQKALFELAKNDESSTIQKKAIDKLTDQKYLAEISCTGKDVNNLVAAFEKLTEKDLIVEVSKRAENYTIRKMAYTKAGTAESQEALVDMAKKDSDYNVRVASIKKIDDKAYKDLLITFAKNDKDSDVRIAAINKLTDKKLLKDISQAESKYEVRMAAFKQLNETKSQVALADIAVNDSDEDKRMEALDEVSDQKLLSTILEKSHNADIKIKAIEKLEASKWQNLFIRTARTEHSAGVRDAALAKIKDGNTRLKIRKDGMESRCRNLLQDVKNKDEHHERLRAARELVSLLTSNPDILSNERTKIHDMLSEHTHEDSTRSSDCEPHTDIGINMGSFTNFCDRKEIVRNMTDQSLLGDIALFDNDEFIRKIALENLDKSSKGVLNRIINEAESYGFRRIAYKKLGTENSREAIIDCAKNGCVEERLEAVKTLDGEKMKDVLLDIIIHESYHEVLDAALSKIKDKDALAQLVKKSDHYNTRAALYEKIGITDTQEAIADKAMHEGGSDSIAMLKKLSDQNLIAEIARKANYEDVRQAAIGLITDETIKKQFSLELECDKLYSIVQDSSVHYLEDRKEAAKKLIDLLVKNPKIMDQTKRKEIRGVLIRKHEDESFAYGSADCKQRPGHADSGLGMTNVPGLY